MGLKEAGNIRGFLWLSVKNHFKRVAKRTESLSVIFYHEWFLSMPGNMLCK